jgi:hypothetical protein
VRFAVAFFVCEIFGSPAVTIPLNQFSKILTVAWKKTESEYYAPLIASLATS